MSRYIRTFSASTLLVGAPRLERWTSLEPFYNPSHHVPGPVRAVMPR
jgi:hypothetical protein